MNRKKLNALLTTPRGGFKCNLTREVQLAASMVGSSFVLHFYSSASGHRQLRRLVLAAARMGLEMSPMLTLPSDKQRGKRGYVQGVFNTPDPSVAKETIAAFLEQATHGRPVKLTAFAPKTLFTIAVQGPTSGS